MRMGFTATLRPRPGAGKTCSWNSAMRFAKLQSAIPRTLETREQPDGRRERNEAERWLLLHRKMPGGLQKISSSSILNTPVGVDTCRVIIQYPPSAVR